MTEEEISAKEKELEEREGEIAKKEESLNEREAAIAKREADASTIAETIKKEFEAREEAQKAEFEERLKQRDDVIKQLASGSTEQQEENAFSELNKRRLLQRAN